MNHFIKILYWLSNQILYSKEKVNKIVYKISWKIGFLFVNESRIHFTLC